MEGKGAHACAEGSRYEGEFRANYRHGRGTCKWGNRHETPFRFVELRISDGTVSEVLPKTEILWNENE